MLRGCCCIPALRTITLQPWTAVLSVSWQLGSSELLTYLLDKEAALPQKGAPCPCIRNLDMRSHFIPFYLIRSV